MCLCGYLDGTWKVRLHVLQPLAPCSSATDSIYQGNSALISFTHWGYQQHSAWRHGSTHLERKVEKFSEKKNPTYSTCTKSSPNHAPEFLIFPTLSHHLTLSFLLNSDFSIVLHTKHLCFTSSSLPTIPFPLINMNSTYPSPPYLSRPNTNVSLTRNFRAVVPRSFKLPWYYK